jgi:hypothetical protein
MRWIADLGRRRQSALGVAATAVALLVGACGADDDSTPDAARSTEHATVTDATGATEPSAAVETPPASGSASSEPADLAQLAATAVLDDGCDLPPPATWDLLGSMHTVVESPDPVTVAVGSLDGPVCPGGRLRVSLRLTNEGAERVTVEDPRLIFGGGPPKWVLATLADITLEPGGSTDLEVLATVPAVAPGGGYWLSLYGYGPGGDIAVDMPA